MLRNEKILITGPTSQVALPLARELARDNEVYGLARLSREADVASLRDIGVKPLKVDLAKGSFDAVPDDFTYVVNMAVVVGTRYHGFAGALAAFLGIMAAPSFVVMGMGWLYLRFGGLSLPTAILQRP